LALLDADAPLALVDGAVAEDVLPYSVLLVIEELPLIGRTIRED